MHILIWHIVKDIMHPILLTGRGKVFWCWRFRSPRKSLPWVSIWSKSCFLFPSSLHRIFFSRNNSHPGRKPAYYQAQPEPDYNKNVEPENRNKRARRYAQDFIFWFGDRGEALPYGRSLTYRFAQAGFWCGLALAQRAVYQHPEKKPVIIRNFMRIYLPNPSAKIFSLLQGRLQ